MYLARLDYNHIGTVKTRTNTVIVSKSENEEDNPQASPSIPTLPRLQLSKLMYRCWVNITSFWKYGKFDVGVIAKVEDAFGADERKQTTLLQYALTASVVCRLNRLQIQNKQGKVVWK